jgi:hypothetical protein
LARRDNWVFNPNSGGKPIPELVQRRTDARLRRYAEKHYDGRYRRLEIRFRSQFCCIDAYAVPAEPGPNWPPANWPETREEYVERLRTTPIHLCRRRSRGDEEHWGFAFFAYSSEKYELSVFPSGQFFGPPEDAFEVSANVHLQCVAVGRTRRRDVNQAAVCSNSIKEMLEIAVAGW